MQFELIGAVYHLSTVGCYLYGLCLSLEHCARCRVQHEHFAPVGIVRACSDGPCHLCCLRLVDTAFERLGKLCPCLALVVTHVAVLRHGFRCGKSHAERIYLQVAFEMNHYPERLARCEVYLLRQCYRIVVCKERWSYLCYTSGRRDGGIALVDLHYRLGA